MTYGRIIANNQKSAGKALTGLARLFLCLLRFMLHRNASLSLIGKDNVLQMPQTQVI